jgi:hypothetical protein
LRGRFFCGGEVETVQFEKEDPDEEAGALVAVDECMVADDASDVAGCHIDSVRVIAIGVELVRTSEGGLEEAPITDTRGTSIQGKKTVMEREDIALVDPVGILHFESV